VITKNIEHGQNARCDEISARSWPPAGQCNGSIIIKSILIMIISGGSRHGRIANCGAARRFQF
jgi:hypothetical protein